MKRMFCVLWLAEVYSKADYIAVHIQTNIILIVA